MRQHSMDDEYMEQITKVFTTVPRTDYQLLGLWLLLMYGEQGVILWGCN